MKKLFLVTLISAVLTAAVFAEPKTYVIDLGDSNIKTIEVKKNPYGDNYQNVAPAVFVFTLIEPNSAAPLPFGTKSGALIAS